jgi:hypothetical protein
MSGQTVAREWPWPVVWTLKRCEASRSSGGHHHSYGGHYFDCALSLAINMTPRMKAMVSSRHIGSPAIAHGPEGSG